MLMKKQFNFLTAIVVALLFSCNSQPTKPADEPIKLVFRFELDSVGNIKNEDVKQQLIKLAKDIGRNADRLILNAYSEQTGDKEKNNQIAFDMADAAKKLMVSVEERAYYNVGVNVLGYANPVNAAYPADIKNRRIEFTYIK